MTPTDQIIVPGYSGRAVRVPAGATVRVTDLEGTQIGDLFVINAEDPSEVFSPSLTRLVVFHAFPKPGEAFYSNRRRPLLTFLTDTSPGRHDITFAPCDAALYRELGVTEYHPNCQDNFFAAIRAIGVDLPFNPDPINIFQNSPMNADGTITIAPALSKAGDYVEFRAERNLVLALTACSVDIAFDGVQVNGGRSTPLGLSITAAGS